MKNEECKFCGARRGFKRFDQNDYCFSCGYNKTRGNLDLWKNQNEVEWDGHLPKPAHMPRSYEEYCLEYQLDTDTREKYNIYYTEELGGRLIFPIFYRNELKAYQGRSLTDDRKWYNVSFKYPWGHKFPFIHHKDNTGTYVFVEDIVSAIRVSKHANVIALLGTKFNKHLRRFLTEFVEKCIIWGDNDEAGQKMHDKFVQEFWMLPVKKIITDEDPKCYTDEEIEEILYDRLQPRSTNS